MKTVCIVGGSFTGNHGAEAMLITCIRRIREHAPDTHFIVMTPCIKADRAVLRDASITLISSTPVSLVFSLFPLSLLGALLSWCKIRALTRIVPASIQRLMAADLYIDIAGVSFMDGRLLFVPYNVFSLMPALLLQIPIIKCAQALGPFNNRFNRLCARFCLSRCTRIFARGEDTLKNLMALGLPSDLYSLSTDVAFCHLQGDSLTQEQPEYSRALLASLDTHITSGARLIGICPSSLLAAPRSTREAYITFIAYLTTQYAQPPYHVVLFPHATREENIATYRNNDLRVIRDVQQRVHSHAHITYVDKNIHADDIKRIITRCDIAVVSRFHAMIAALTTYTPVCVLGWSHKYREVMALCGMDDMIVDYHTTSRQDISARIDTLLSQRTEYHQKIKAHMPHVQQMAREQFDYIYTHLTPPRASTT